MAEISKLGRYELRNVLGQGAMGVVYEGYDPTLSRRVAVKTILQSHALGSDAARDYSIRFVREAKAAARLNHPNIVQVYDFGVERDTAYIVMEFLQGRELRSYFEAREKFDAAETVRIMGELLDALDFAHEARVIHRDVKPANIMLDSQRRVKLADFGVARILDSERSAAETMVGTPAFMSPEQISGQKVDRRTDLFSAGSILYLLLTGERPFKGDGAWTVAKKIMQDDPPHPSAIVASVSPVFDAIVKKALAKIPSQRFASAKEFAVALRATLAAGQPVAVAEPAPKSRTEVKASDAEVEFWRAIQNSADPAEFEFYLEQFPAGTYSQLARHKIGKLREPLEAARNEAAAKEKARQEEERAKREVEEKARREAETAARIEAEEHAQREAEESAKREAEEKARREVIETNKREATERAKREVEEKTRRELLEKSQREAAEKAKREAEEKARQAQALARLKQPQDAAAHAKSAVDADAAVELGRPPGPPATAKKSLVVPAVIGVVVIAAAIVAYLMSGRTPAPPPVVQAPAPAKVEPPAQAKPEAPAIDVEKLRRESEERIRREFAEKAAAEKALAEKAVTAKLAAEKAAAAKTAVEKAAAAKLAEKTAAERAAAEKLAAEKAASAKLAVERAAIEKAAAERSAAERAAAEKAAADKVAAQKAAAEKSAAEKTAAEKIAATKAAAAVPAVPGASATSADTLLNQATAVEREGKMVDAVRLYIQAARAGSGQAAKKLGDIYYNGAPGVSPDNAESAKWYNLARARGVQVGPAGGR